MPRVLVTDYAWPSLDIERGILGGLGAELVVAETGEPDELVELAGGVDAILTNWKKVPPEALDRAPECLVVSRYGVGVDNIPVDHATELGVLVVNVPDFCLPEVSDHAMALVLACARRVARYARETREGTEQKGREALEQALKQQNLPYAKLRGSAVLAEVIRDSGFKKAEDFYLALGSGKLQPGQIVNKVIQRLKTEQVAEEEAVPLKAPKARHAVSSENFGITVRGVDDVLVRLAKCCTPLPGDKIVGYVSMGKGITIHREDCSNVKALKRNPERFTKVSWDGGATQSFRVQISVDSWDRPRLLEDVARTFAEHGANIVEYGGHVEDQLAKNWYVAEVGDVKALRSLLTALRNIDAVFDAYRVTPS